jgi:uncharacterized membrane protein YhaH (DUF805 family)
VIGCLAGAARVLGRSGGSMPGLAVTALVIFVVMVVFPWLALAVRQLHDTGRPGTYLLLAYVPFEVIALVWFFTQPGDPGDNQFGALPEQARARPADSACQDAKQRTWTLGTYARANLDGGWLSK